MRAQIESTEPKFRDEILVSYNERNPALFDVYRLNIKTGDRELIAENPGKCGWLGDRRRLPCSRRANPHARRRHGHPRT